MTAIIQIALFLLAVLVLVAVVAQRLKTAPSILLVVAGVALALVPGLPPVGLAPELVLLVLLPPLIYSAGVSMSWREFRFNLAPSRCWRSAAWCSPPARSPPPCIICSAGNGAWRSRSAPSSRRPTWWRRSPSPGGLRCRGAFS